MCMLQRCRSLKCACVSDDLLSGFLALLLLQLNKSKALGSQV